MEKHMKACKLPDCDTEISKSSGFGYCRPHYRAFKKHGDPCTKFADKPCAECGATFAPTHGSHKSCQSCRDKRESRMTAERRAANRPKNVEYNRAWRKKNPTYHAEYNKRWRSENEAEYRKYYREYRENNLEKVRAAYARWEAVNPNHTIEWTRRNPERAREIVRRRRARLRAVPTFDVTSRDISRMVERQRGRCAYCPSALDGGYHIDHVMPVSLGGANGIGNIVPACAACNTSKGNFLLSEWRYKDRLSAPPKRRHATVAISA